MPTNRGNNYEYIIRENANNTGLDFYQIKKIDAPSAYLDQNQALDKTSTDTFIETKTGISVAPYQKQVSKSASINSITNNSRNVNTNSKLTPITYYSSNHIFSDKEIEAMKPAEFDYYEAQIMEQTRKGQIRIEKKSYKNYKNPLTNSDKIYTREEISKISTKEFSNYEKEIDAQMKSIGIPSVNDLTNDLNTGGVIYVHSYTRTDGTKVRGHYRSLPN